MKKNPGTWPLVYFNIEMHDNINLRKDKKICAAAIIFCLRAIVGIFWPEESPWSSSDQKIPKVGRRPKNPGQSMKHFFVLPNGDKCCVLNIEWLFCNRTSFLLEKVSFLVQKFWKPSKYHLICIIKRSEVWIKLD